MKNIATLFRNHFSDFYTDKWVRLYGILLCLTHVFTFFYWSESGVFRNKVLSHPYAICWPYFQSCDGLKVFLIQNSSLIHALYLLLIFLTLSVFIFSNRQALKLLLFAALVIIKFVIFSMDYRFMGNYHYMAFIAYLAFLVFPQRLSALKLVVTCFYIAAGMIKFNTDWLSGAAMLTPPIIKGKLLEWAVVYVIFLELLIAPLVFSKNKLIRYLVIFQLVAFHIFSWHVVGWFYPCMMACLISVYIIFEVKPEKFIWNKKYLFFVVPFFVAQLIPFFLAKDAAVSGQGRILSLNMLDAMTECQSLFIYKNNSEFKEMLLLRPRVGVRIQCDPIFYVSLLKEQCRDIHVGDADFILQIRRVSNKMQQESFYWQNVCSQGVPLSLLGVFK